MASPLPSPGTPNMNRADSQIAFHQIYWAFNFVDCRKMRFATVFYHCLERPHRNQSELNENELMFIVVGGPKSQIK